MAHRVFFSFHYERDIWRVSQIRNSWFTHGSYYEAGYIDAAGWEAVKKGGDLAIKRWISDNLEGTTVTVVLIGSETAYRPWVKYEIMESIRRGNGLLGVYIHNVKSNTDVPYDPMGGNPFIVLHLDGYATYDWVGDKGYNNFGDWVEKAYQQARAGHS